jgi:hypothetical protein
MNYAIKYDQLFYFICYIWSSITDYWFHGFVAEKESHPDILNISPCNESLLEKLIVIYKLSAIYGT